ncbi:FtsB family cell division protein [Salininema proteolyticum]|uniref:Septum formation initiator family protein n=1 Tax=Salininema proteolyticum TaxID=1607685 RepID=A0ABV8TSP6_9ACTN
MSSRRSTRPGEGRGGSRGNPRGKGGPGRVRATRTRAGAPPDLQRRKKRPPRRISRRAAVLALVLSVLALAYAYPLRTYVEQRIEIDRLEDRNGEQRDRIGDLETEREKWEDDTYVEAQIRERLGLVPPGEELVVVLGGEDGRTRPDPRGDSDPDRQWYDEFLDTVEAADHPEDDE